MTETISAEAIMVATGANKTKLKVWEAGGLNEAKVGLEYDARKFYLWYRDNVYRPSLVEGEGEEELDLDLMSHRARYEKARAQKYQIKLDRLKEQYVPIEKAEYALYEMAGLFEEIAGRLPEELARIAVGQPEDTMLVEIDKYVRQMLLDYSRSGDAHNEEENQE